LADPSREELSWLRLYLKARQWIPAGFDALVRRLEKRPYAFLGISLSIFLITSFAHAKRRFWFDELITFYICRLPTFHDVWQSLVAGIDFNPPLIYLLTRLSHQTLGVSSTTTRLPEVLFFVVMCSGIFLFVRRRCGVLYGLAAMWFPLITMAYSYSVEARPHAFVLGFCAIAMVAWQRAAEGGRRTWALALMFLSIAGFLMSHCYSVLILIPLGIGELARLAVRRKPDWILWSCIVAPIASVAVYIPMMQHMKGYSAQTMHSTPGLAAVPRFYSSLFNDQGGFWHETVWPIFFILVLAAFAKRSPSDSQAPQELKKVFPFHELAFLVTLSLIPFFGQMLALMANSIFYDRYALSAIVGMSPLLAFFVYRVTCGSQRVALAMTLVIMSWFMVDFGIWFNGLFQNHHPWDLGSIQLASLPEDTLIVISDPHMFMEAEHYEPPEVTGRLRLLTDPALDIKYTGSDMVDQTFYRTNALLPVKGRIEDYHAFLAATKHFIAVGPFTDPEDWLFRDLITSGATVLVKGQTTYPTGHGANCMLVDVTTPGS
jgi:hypothetical protein